MFPKLKEVSLDGSARVLKKPFLRQLTAGAYTAISSKLKAYKHADTEDMGLLQYQAIIVFFSIWECDKQDEETPLCLRVINRWYKKRKPKEPKTAVYHKGELSHLIRQLNPDDFISVTDYFADQSPRDWIEEMYQITDQHLQSTSEATKEALKNE